MSSSSAHSRSPRRADCSTLPALDVLYKHEAVATLQEQRIIIEKQRQRIESLEQQMTNLLRESSRMGRALTAHGIE